jgi:uncharacterized membrane protein YhaH (DUF805 family)
MAHLEVKPRSRSYWWLWVIIILLIVAAVIYYFEIYKPANTAMIADVGRSFIADVASVLKSLTIVSA